MVSLQAYFHSWGNTVPGIQTFVCYTRDTIGYIEIALVVSKNSLLLPPAWVSHDMPGTFITIYSQVEESLFSTNLFLAFLKLRIFTQSIFYSYLKSFFIHLKYFEGCFGLSKIQHSEITRIGLRALFYTHSLKHGIKIKNMPVLIGEAAYYSRKKADLNSRSSPSRSSCSATNLQHDSGQMI